jgi:hypothetical protein
MSKDDWVEFYNRKMKTEKEISNEKERGEYLHYSVEGILKA